VLPIELSAGVFSSDFLHRWYKYQLYLAAFWCALVWVLTLMALLAYGVACFVKNKFPSLAPLKLLRVMGNLSAGPLFIPLLQTLLSTFQCADPNKPFWRDGQYVCGSTTFVALQAGSTVLAVLLVALSLLFSAIFYESNGLSRSLAARAHGRADIVMVVLQAALVLAVNTFSSRITLSLVLPLTALAGVTWLGVFACFASCLMCSCACLPTAFCSMHRRVSAHRCALPAVVSCRRILLVYALLHALDEHGKHLRRVR